GNAGDLLDSIRGELTETAGPSLDRLSRLAGRISGPQLVLENHPGKAERQHAFGAGRDRDPFVRAGSGMRHARFNLNERPAALRMALPHLSVSEALCDGRVPGAEEIAAKTNDMNTAREIERRELLAHDAHPVRARASLF